MKKLISAIVLVFIFALIVPSVAVFADDPPETDVDIVVITPDDVDLDVGIVAGGDVDVTVDGYDIDQMALQDKTNAMAIDYLNSKTAGGSINSEDWWRYYRKYLEPQIMKLFSNAQTTDQNMKLSMEALSKLIVSNDLTYQQIKSLNQEIFNIASLSYTNNVAGQERDDAIWNQLMFGAEYHLGLLDIQVQEQAQQIVDLQAEREQLKTESSLLRADLTTAYSNHINLSDYVSYLSSQYLYYIWAIGAGSVILLALVVVLSIKVRHLKER